ncbi:MAG: hypothetical protein HZA93_00745 [Verrucomicrobia bacterium]|nr:hypothetical protein [Verrucomicrobiota bacterium]
MNSPRHFSPPGCALRRRRGAAFTLAEIMIGSAIGGFILAGVLSAFIMMTRSAQRLYNYNGMEVEARRALEEFAQDVRMASAITYHSATSLSLTVPDNYTGYSNRVTYYFNSATTGATAGCFYRRPGGPVAHDTTTPGYQILTRNVYSCAFNRYDRLGTATTGDGATKRLELSLRMRVTSTAGAAATENAISATYLLRNKTAN